MCGIVGVVGPENAGRALLEGLTKLEYRGYDSAGIAVLGKKSIKTVRRVGKISALGQALETEKPQGSTGIGHSRWATHGKVTEKNAHPHADCTGEVAVVHNGIIENYLELKDGLQKRGHKFSSDTDSEVIAHLIEERLSANPKNSLEEAVRLSTSELRGSYALLAISSRDGGKIVAARNESPLILGIGKGATYAASDALPLLGKASEAVVLGEKQVAVLTRKGAVVMRQDTGEKIEPEKRKLDWNAEAASKNGFEHFMLKEILEEPQMIRGALAQDKKLFEEMAGEIVRTERVMFVACGTSRHAALVGRYLFNKMAEKYCDVMIGSEFSYFANEANRKTLIVAISQSGETADVLDGVRKAKEKGARVFSIVNVQNSSLDRLSDKTIFLNCGPEIGVAATKSFINQLIVFYLLAFASQGKFEQGKAELEKIAGTVEGEIAENREVAEAIAKKIHKQSAAYFIGRGINFAVALEAALKMKEITYIHAEGMPAGELKHGTLALIEEGTPVVAINPKDYTFFETQGNAMETKARGAYVIGISDSASPTYDALMKIPKAQEIYYPLLCIVPLQLLAYYTAVMRGNDPDKPRNLAKSVTVK
ncbi:MAG: glutamine--fructose-6-phosphate transaminase (isomerizing) [Candidatus Micrarchaeia archaeon]|jgi:glucosamine--fructose-6-phosphate aminotransferase (isomerizing)